MIKFFQIISLLIAYVGLILAFIFSSFILLSIFLFFSIFLYTLLDKRLTKNVFRGLLIFSVGILMFTPADVVFYFGYSTISIFSEILAWLLMAIGGLFLSIEVIKKHKQIGR